MIRNVPRMPHFVSAVLWLVLSPIAALCDVVTALVIAQFYPFYHGTDVLLFSAMFAMAMNAVLIPPIPAILEIADISWTSGLCQFYVWSFITFRILQILTLLCITLQWSSILKASSRGKKVNITGIIKGTVPTIWIVSAVIGLLPIIGAVPDSYHSGTTCFFMSSNLAPGFAIFIGILIVTCMCISFISTFDATMLLKYVRKVALVKYGAGRFYLPKKNSEVPSSGTYTTHERYGQLTFAWDICKFVLVWTLVSFAINHIPYTVLELVSLTSGSSSSNMEEAVIWLVLVESLCLPNILWCASRRYRRALVYTWKVHVLRHPAEDEADPTSCRLQSYHRRNQNGIARTTQQQTAARSVVDNLEHNMQHSQRLSPVNEQAMRQIQLQQMNQVNDHPSRENAGVHIQPLHVVSNESRPSASAKPRSSPLTLLSTPTHKYTFLEPEAEGELVRTASNSRREWKDQMRKKHLPPIFVNEAFDHGEPNRLRRQNHQEKMYDEIKDAVQVHVREDSASQASLHFYMSGDYHHDNINTDSLPRKNQPIESESEGVSEQYDEGDIENILDTGSGTSAENMYKTGIKHMSSFSAPADEDKIRNKYRQQEYNHSQDSYEESHSQQNLPDVITITPYIEGNLATEREETSGGEDECQHTTRSSPVHESMSTIEEVDYPLSYPEPDMDSKPTSDHVFRTDFDPYGAFEVKLPVESLEYDTRHPSVSVSSFEDEIKLSPLHQRTYQAVSDRRWDSLEQPTDVDSTSDYYHRPVDRTHSNTSTPLSYTFDEGIDKGFEDALSVGYPDNTSSISGSRQEFGSIKEGSETESVSNPFQECNVSLDEDNFKSCAIVPSNALNDSRSTSSSENPFDSLPPLRTGQKTAFHNHANVHGESSPTSDITLNSTTEGEYGDSGFNSGLDTGLSRDAASSPWPIADDKPSLDVDMCFESDFSKSQSDSTENQNHKSEKSQDTKLMQKDYFTPKSLSTKTIDPVYF